MVAVDARRVLLLKVVVLLLGVKPVEREHYVAGFVAHTVHLPKCGERGVGIVVGGVLLGLVDAHHAKGEVANVDVSADKLCHVVAHELLRQAATYHHHLAVLAYVYVVDEPSEEHLLLVYSRLVGIDAAQRGVVVVVAQAEGEVVAVDGGAHLVDVGSELVACSVEVAVVELYPAALL